MTVLVTRAIKALLHFLAIFTASVMLGIICIDVIIMISVYCNYLVSGLNQYLYKKIVYELLHSNCSIHLLGPLLGSVQDVQIQLLPLLIIIMGIK